jgi:hypothetical protein
MTNDLFFRQKNIYVLVLLSTNKKENYFIYLDGHLNNTDDSQHKQQSSSAINFSKLKASFR